MKGFQLIRSFALGRFFCSSAVNGNAAPQRIATLSDPKLNINHGMKAREQQQKPGNNYQNKSNGPGLVTGKG
jgi:hypothetical protein